MMKNLTLALGLMIIATPAFATSARLNALGENGSTGSYYIQDVRNIFLNPAQIVHYKKKLVLEYSQTDTGVNSAGTAIAANPQGLFTNTFGDYTYGVSLGNNSLRATTLAQNAGLALAGTLGTTATSFLSPQRTLEVFFAGEGSLNWGLSVFYAGVGDRGNAASIGGAERQSHLFGARAGVDMGNFAVFTTVGINSNTQIMTGTTQPELKGKLSLDLAATYSMDNSTVFARYQNTGADINTTTPASTTEIRNSAYGLGIGHKYEASKSISLFGRLEADYTKASTAGTDAKTWEVPFVIGAEAQALSWLAFRGSVSQALWSQFDNGAGVRNNTLNTTLGAGAGLTFGDVQIDGTMNTVLVGNTGLGIGAPLANVAMTYNF